VTLRIDHVVYAVRDLRAAAERFRRELGLDSVAGGRHPAWGTANRIVPFGDDYVELICVTDATAATASTFGRGVLERAALGDGWLTWCAATDELDAVAARLGLAVTDGVRERPDGSVLRWRSAGLEDERREPWMPFFIEWGAPPGSHPGRARAGHGVRPRGIVWVEVGGDAGRLRAWLGGDEIPIRAVDGRPGMHAVGVAIADGELAIS
jgi:hypothetical protein